MARKWNDQHEVVDGGCWYFTGHIRPNGYGKKWSRIDKVSTNAHRTYWHEYRGPIEKGLVVDHLCRNKWCVNPDHLEPVTQAENIRRGIGPEMTSLRYRKASRA